MTKSDKTSNLIKRLDKIPTILDSQSRSILILLNSVILPKKYNQRGVIVIMVAIQITSFLPQLVRLKKIEKFSVNISTMMESLSIKEVEAVGKALEINALKTKEEKMDPWI